MAARATVTLTAASVNDVTVDEVGSDVEVVLVDGAGPVWFTTDGTAPTQGAAGEFVVVGGPGAFVSVAYRVNDADDTVVVRLIAAVAQSVQVGTV